MIFFITSITSCFGIFLKFGVAIKIFLYTNDVVSFGKENFIKFKEFTKKKLAQKTY